MREGTSKPPRWSARARAAYERSVDYIAREDPRTAELVQERVEHSVSLIAEQPRIGTPTATPGVRRYPIPRTGHVITYRLVKREVRVLRWFRARQNEPFRP